MGYDIRLDFDTPNARIRDGATVADLPRGGQYAVYMDGAAPITANDLYLHITFNYSWYYYETIEGGNGLKELIGKTTTEALPILKAAREKIVPMIDEERRTGKVLSQTWGKGSDYDDTSTDYWKTSAKNAVRALDSFIELCEIAPDCGISIYY